MAGVEDEQRRTVRDYIHRLTPSITRPSLAENNFKLKLVLIIMVRQSQFSGRPVDYANSHFSIFLEMCDTVKINGNSNVVIHLWLFLSSLKCKAMAWIHSLPPRSIATWLELTEVFLAHFFPLLR